MGPIPQVLSKVGVKTLLRSREGSHGHGAVAHAESPVGAGFRSILLSEAVRAHMTRGSGGSHTPGGWALPPLTPRRVH